MDISALLDKAKQFANDEESKKKFEEGWRNYEKFLSLYPFRAHPENIDLLTPEKLYNPGTDDYFFLWIEHRLKHIGHLRIGSALIWENARDNIAIFKRLLKLAVDDTLSISQKIDANWEDIRFFGGDKNVAKKIIWCYYPDDLLPIFKTDDLEFFAKMLELDYKKESIKKWGKEYESLSMGEKYELLNILLLNFKNKYSEFKDWKTPYFSRFLYETFQPEHAPSVTARPEPKPLQSLGLLFEPSNEQELVYLFAKFHQELGFPYILRISADFPDAEVMNKKKETKKIEFELYSSNFIQHRHPASQCDFIVCWEDDLQENVPDNFPQIIVIKDLIESLK